MATKAEKKTGRKPEDLNPMELAFCEFFALVGSETYSNGTASAQKARYAAKSAHTSAWKLLRRDVVRTRIQEIHAEQMSRLYLTCDKVMSDIEHGKTVALAKGDIPGYLRGCELQAKYLGILVDRQRFELEPERQRELSECERTELLALASLRLEACIAGPGSDGCGDVAVGVIEGEANTPPDEGLHPPSRPRPDSILPTPARI